MYHIHPSIVNRDSRSFIAAEAALSLSERIDDKETLTKTITVVYAYIHHWTNNIRTSLKALLYGYQIGMRSGEVEFAMHNLNAFNLILFMTAARPLGVLASEMEEYCDVMYRCEQKILFTVSRGLLQMVKTIQGMWRHPSFESGTFFDDDDILEVSNVKQFEVIDRTFLSYKMQLAYLFGHYEQASQYAESSSDVGTTILQGYTLVMRHYFFKGLTAIALASQGVDRRKNLGIVNKVTKSLTTWTRNGSLFCLHMTHLLEAETSAATGKVEDAVEKYKVAIQSANRGGFVHDKALAHERAGIFHLETDIGDTYWASYHLQCAIECYKAWDAQAKVTQLIDKYRHLDLDP
jgi:hypothetical protein